VPSCRDADLIALRPVRIDRRDAHRRGAAHRERIVAGPAIETDGALRHAGAAEIAGNHDSVVAGAGIDDDLLDIDHVELDAIGRNFVAAGIDVDVEIGIAVERRRDANVVVAAGPRDVERVAGSLSALAAIDAVDAIARRVVDDVVAFAGVDGVGAAAPRTSLPPSVLMMFAPNCR
jgi:hypothetical protein